MSIWPALWNRLLPQDCFLCGCGPIRGLLCDACRADLPVLTEGCPVCGDASPPAQTCGACLKAPPHFDASLAPYSYGFPVDKLVQSLKYRHRLAVAGFLAEAMLAGPRPAGDLVVPLPLSLERLRERGFNQAGEIARRLARALGLPLDLDACSRERDTASQAILPWKARRKNIRHAFACRVDLSGQAVIVVDDVMTSGATLDEFARTLKDHGAARVTNWVAARARRN